MQVMTAETKQTPKSRPRWMQIVLNVSLYRGR